MPTRTTKEQVLQALACAAAVCAVCALPLLGHDLAAGHDSVFHLLRLEGLAQALGGGAALPVRIYPLLLGGYGYGCGLFYPDLFLYPFALLRNLLHSPEIAFKALLLACTAASCLTSYLAGRGILRSHAAGCTAMVFYGLCQYHLSNLFVRSAIGEVQAMVFVPLVVWGLWNLTEQDFSHPAALTLGFLGLLLSHTASLALSGLLAVGWCLVRLPRLLQLRRLGQLAGCAALCLALGCYYWLPLLEQFCSDTFTVTAVPLTSLAANVLTPGQLFGLSSYMGLGLSVLALPVLAVLAHRKKAALSWLFLGLGLALSLCTLQGVPWARLDATPLTSLQFPWRLHQLSQWFFALSAAQLAILLPGQKQRLGTLALCFALGVGNLACLWGALPQQVNYSDNHFTANRSETFYVVGAEWVPLGADIREFSTEPAAQYTQPDGSPAIGAYAADGSFSFPYEGVPGVYTPPLLWYKGYSASLNGQPLAVQKDGGGRVLVTLPDAAAPGTVTVRYTGTALQTLSEWVSLLALAGTVIGLILHQKKRK